MRDTIEDMDIDIEQKGNTTEFLEKEVDSPDCKVIEERNRLRFKKISSKREGDKIIDSLRNTLNNHKYIKNKNLGKTKFFN